MDKTVPLGRVKGTLTPPCSKSYAQRALAASLLCGETSVLRNLEFCDDTRSALRCIETLGARVKHVDASTLSIEGGLHPRGKVLHVGESGLATRLFTPIASLCGMPVTIEGQGTLLRRPMHMMIEPLRRLGVRVRDNDGYLPFEVCGPIRGGEIDVDGSVSSQFITGLLLALPLSQHDTTLHVRSAVSTPYLDMTVDTAARFGVEICHNDYKEFYIEGGQRYRPAFFSIEGDWSAAAMLLVAGAVAGEVTVKNVSMLSKQADTAICTALVRAGAAVINDEDSVTASHRPLRAFEFDATHCPDLFPALAALAAAAQGESVIRGTSRLEHKECNRADAIREEYAKAGIEVDTSQEDVMRIRGGRIRAARAKPRRPPHGHVDGRRRAAQRRGNDHRRRRMRRQELPRILRRPGKNQNLNAMNIFGHNFRLAIWGESHGPQIGISIDGVPAGIPLSAEDFEADLARRRSGARGTTPRREPDIPQIVSGLYNGMTTGAPLTIEFANTDTHSQDYATVARHYRPSHADLVAYHRFNGFNDPRGGGHFSARLTVAFVAAGVVAKKMLPPGIAFDTRLTEIGGCTDPARFDEVLRAAAADLDSVGGIIECRVQGVPLGLGQPFFDSAESLIAHLLFAIPAVKGVEFGSGFAGARLRGSQNNDPLLDVEGTTATNNAGGINGGITNGNEIVVRAAVKPTPSIGREQNTYNLATDKVEPLTIRGRHDVCVALRGAVVAEAAVAIALANLIRH